MKSLKHPLGGLMLSMGLMFGTLQPGFSQSSIDLTPLSAYQNPTPNWQTASDVDVNPTVNADFRPVAGQGLLVNKPDDKNKSDIVSRQEFGDFDLRLEFMMAPGSNSGIYLQGLYEIQLRDSWGVKHPTFGDCGGVYQRWDESKPEGQKGYEGVAPQLNAAKAPGLWQTLYISFTAPRFDQSGRKVKNARVLSVVLNGVEVIAGVDLTGPTRGALYESERLRGPIRLQGDHGAVAFRNIQLTPFDQTPPAFTQLNYEVFDFGEMNAPKPDWAAPVATGTSPNITWEVSQFSEKYGIRYQGKFNVAQAGTYHFETPSRGTVWLSVDGKEVISESNWGGRAEVTLSAGSHDLEIRYLKWDSWFVPALGLVVEGPGFRRHSLHSQSSLIMERPVSPILISNKNTPYLFRCFVDYTEGEKSHRIVHAVNASDPAGVHYTVNLDNGGMVQVWKDEFMDATPMWHDRGDGSARPMGAVLTLGDKAQVVTSAGAFAYKGYFLDEQGYPEFRYSYGALSLKDQPKAMMDGKGLERTLTWEGGAADARFRFASADKVKALGNGLYVVGDHAYYIQVPETKKLKAQVETGSQAGLYWSLAGAGSIRYSLWW
jgi:hypothetical protein